MRGLIGRDGLPAGDGLLLETNSIHMLFMRFPIDALFLAAPEVDGTRRVVAVRPDLPAWRGVVWYVRGAKAVIELPAGTLAQHDVRAGDRSSSRIRTRLWVRRRLTRRHAPPDRRRPDARTSAGRRAQAVGRP